MDELGRELGRELKSLDHNDGFSEARQRRPVSGSWFKCSVWPFDSNDSPKIDSLRATPYCRSLSRSER